MKKLALLPFILSPLPLISINTNTNNIKSNREIINYLNLNDYEYFKYLKQNILNDIKHNHYVNDDKTLIAYLDYYSKLVNLEIASLYDNINLNISKDLLIKPLSYHNQLVNSHYYRTITSRELNNIKSLYEKWLKYNEDILRLNQLYDNYVYLIQQSKIKSKLLQNYLKQNSQRLFTNRSITSESLTEMDLLLKESKILNDNLKSVKYEYLAYDTFIKDFNNYTFDNLIIKLREIKIEMESLIKSQKLLPDTLIKDIDKLKYDVVNQGKLNDERQDYFLNMANNITSKYAFNNLKKEYLNEISDFNKIKEAYIKEHNIDGNLKYKLNNFYDYGRYTEYINLLNEYFKLLENNKNLQNQIDNEINNQSLNANMMMEYYKNYNVINLDVDNVNKTNELLINQNMFYQSLLSQSGKNLNYNEIFKEQTINLFSLDNDNIVRYELDNFLNPLSFNLQNAKLLFDIKDTHYVNFEIIDIKLNLDKLNEVIFDISAVNKYNNNIHYNFSLTKTFNEAANLETNYQYLDDLMFINYHNLSKEKFSSFVIKEQQNNYLVNEINNDRQFFAKKNSKINKFLDYEIVNFNLNNSKLNANVVIKYNNQIVKTINLSSKENINFVDENLNETEWETLKDNIDRNKMLNLIKGNVSEILKLIKIKENSKKTHFQYLAENAVLAFNNSYELPSFGNYQMIIKRKNYYSNKDAWADLVFWYTYKNQEVSEIDNLDQYQKRISGFMYQNFEEIMPKNNKFFTSDDFIGNEYLSINENHKAIINTLNESNIEVKKAWSAFNRKNYRSINVSKLIEQQSNRYLNYLLDIKNAPNNLEYSNEIINDYIPLNVGHYDESVSKSNANINSIKNEYYIYFINLEKITDNKMSFQVAFINKQDERKRYISPQRFTLFNLVNDFEQVLYPKIIVNNITYDDLIINEDIINNHYPFELNDATLRHSIVSLKDSVYEYNNFKVAKDKIIVAEYNIKNENSVFIRFAIKDINNNLIVGDKWYEINNFKSYNTFNINPLSFNGSNLNTIYYSDGSVYRKRVLEPFANDLKWEINDNIAKWVFKKKYLQKTFLENNGVNRFLKFEFLMNSIINDNNKASRLNDLNNATIININFEKLLAKQKLSYYFDYPGDSEHLKIQIDAIYNNGDIEFYVSMLNNKFKMTKLNPKYAKLTKHFDNELAFSILDYGMKISMEYTNKVQKEIFLETKQNRFDYENIEYNKWNTPIMFYSDIEYLKNKDVYIPNVNVDYELHNGYKLDAEIMRYKQYEDWELVDNTFLRALMIDGNTFFGSGSIIGKVNNDPNDARFYVMTNHHVENASGKSMNDLKGANFLHDKNGFRLIFTQYTLNNLKREYNMRLSNTHAITENLRNKNIWIGFHNGNSFDNNTSNNDLSIFIIDLNNTLKEQRKRGNYYVVKRIERLMKQNAKFEMRSQNTQPLVPMIREYGVVGFPHFNLSGSINRRQPQGDNYVEVGYKNNYSSIFTGGGGSGSGIYLENNNYYATWQSGNGKGVSSGRRYDTNNTNYFGINWNNENPLSLNNTSSFGSQILRAYLKYGNDFAYPWFYKEIDNDKK